MLSRCCLSAKKPLFTCNHKQRTTMNNNNNNNIEGSSPIDDELSVSSHSCGEHSNTNTLSLHDLRVFCRSESISLSLLRQQLTKLLFLFYLGHQFDISPYFILLVDICRNDRVTYKMIQCVIEYIPGAACVVCANKNVTLDIAVCVYEGHPDAIVIEDDNGWTPLIYLCQNKALNETVAVEILVFLLLRSAQNLCSTAHMMAIYQFITLVVIVLSSFAACSSRHLQNTFGFKFLQFYFHQMSITSLPCPCWNCFSRSIQRWCVVLESTVCLFFT